MSNSKKVGQEEKRDRLKQGIMEDEDQGTRAKEKPRDGEKDVHVGG